MSEKTTVLFICIHNSARSQMAEAFLNKYGKELFEAESAGLEPGTLNPVVVEVMKEEGVDISNNRTKSANDFINNGKEYDYVITVCDEASAERCPVFPGSGQNLHWGFEDPSSIKGTQEEKSAAVRIIREHIKKRIIQFVKEKKI